MTPTAFDSTRALTVVKDTNIDVPVIIVSGCMGEEIAVAAMRNGAADYIMKDNLARLGPAIEREIRELESRKAHRRAEQTIIHMAYHDALTGLVNRNEFDHCLKNALISARRHQLQHILLYLDLDQFKVINDTCGHIAGDALLRQLPVLLQEQVRECDTLARLGGDEFGVLLQSCPVELALQIAENIRQAIKKFRFAWREKMFSIGVSIGMIVIDENSPNMTNILSAADIACYAAKELGRNRIQIYKEDDADLARHHGEMQWVTRIQQALEKDKFVLYRQNMVCLGHECVNCQCFEFLIRLLEDNGDLIPPGSFIPAAERYDLMPEIDRWVIKSAFQYLSRHYAGEKKDNKFLRCFINLSGATLSDETFFKFLRKQLQEYKIDPEIICFEITETAAITKLRNAVDFIRDIKREGCHFALDDFGSGLSSFAYLRTIPVDYLKIDGSFVRNMLHDDMDCTFVEVINQIGHVAGLKTIAESVENEQTAAKLKELGIDFAQGFGIHVPEPIEDKTSSPTTKLARA